MSLLAVNNTARETRRNERPIEKSSRILDMTRSSFSEKVKGSLYLKGPDIDFVAKLASETPNHWYSSNDDGAPKQQEPKDRCLVPAEFASKRVARDGDHWHMTLLRNSEIRLVVKKAKSDDEFAAALSEVIDGENNTSANEDETDEKTSDKNCRKEWNRKIFQFCESFLKGHMKREVDWFVLGIGQQSETVVDKGKGKNRCIFLVCSYPRASNLRKIMGLPPTDFHITLGFKDSDIHYCSKGVDSLLPNQPYSLTSAFSWRRIISTSADLVDAARTAVLGGNGNETIDVEIFQNCERGNFEYAAILLDAAEGLMSLRKLEGKSFRSYSGRDLLSLLGDNDSDLRSFLDILQIRCQISGWQRDFGNLLNDADILIDLLKNINNSFEETNMLRGIALGYKGVALSLKNEWSKAYPCLITSYELHHQEKQHNPDSTSEHRGGATRLDFQREEEAVFIERVLTYCCKITGFKSPIPPLSAFPEAPFDSISHEKCDL